MRRLLYAALLVAIGVLVADRTVNALDTALPQLYDTTVVCPEYNADAGTAEIASVTAAGATKRSLFVSNSSTTCVHVGGRTVSSGGAVIGSGCIDGPNVTVDSKRAWCASDDAADGGISVRVLYGD